MIHTLTDVLQAVRAHCRRATTSSILGSVSESVLGESACATLGDGRGGGVIDEIMHDGGGGGVIPQPGGAAGLTGGVEPLSGGGIPGEGPRKKNKIYLKN